MDKQMKDIFCRMVDTELEKISKVPQLNDVTLANLHKLTDIKKNLLKIEMLEGQVEGGMMGNSYRGNSYAPGYMMGNSYNQGGNSNGMMPMYGGSYDVGYSRNDGMSHLEAAMRDARTEQEREEIRQLMSRYHN